ncbi:MAG: sterol-4-alpha-carboxylate 3-dehydrogenase, partial [Bacteroidota bacterium]
DSTLIKLGYQPALKKAPYSLVYFVAWMSEIISRYFTSGEPVLTRYGVGILKYSLTMNIDEAKQHLNYQPITTTEKSIDDFIEYYTNAKK